MILEGIIEFDNVLMINRSQYVFLSHDIGLLPIFLDELLLKHFHRKNTILILFVVNEEDVRIGTLTQNRNLFEIGNSHFISYLNLFIILMLVILENL